jgi:hypothetical protein
MSAPLVTRVHLTSADGDKVSDLLGARVWITNDPNLGFLSGFLSLTFLFYTLEQLVDLLLDAWCEMLLVAKFFC